MRFVFSRSRRSDEAAEELRAHLDLLTQRYLDEGRTPDEAREAATRQLGNVAMVREDIYNMNGIRWVDHLAHDLRGAVRQLARYPGFAVVVILTMALGIGANTAILSVAYAVLVKPLPYAQPDQIYSVEIVVPERREQIPSLPATVQLFFAWQRAQTVFAAMTALTPWEASITGDGDPERLGGARVATNFFSVLGVPVARGRDFFAEEAQPGKDRVVIISDGLWRRRYGADQHVAGKSVSINGEPHEIIGVAAPSLLVPTRTQLNAVIPFGPRVDIWKPVAPTGATLNNESWDHGVFVRLRDRADMRLGQQQLVNVLNDLARAQMPGVKTEAFVQLIPVHDLYAAKLRRPLLLVVAAALLLLVTAATSIANVCLARSASRTGEIAMRVALGAGRGRIASQLFIETLLLALFGGAIGTAIALWGSRLLSTMGPDDVRVLSTSSINIPFLLLAVLVTILTGTVCGLVPVWHGTRRDPAIALKDAGRTAPVGVGRMRRILVSVEMALATLLLASGALLLHSFVNVVNSDRGYDVEGILTADVSLFGQRYQSGAARGAFYSELMDRIRGLPSVTAAGAINNLPAVSAADGPSRAILLPEDTSFQAVVLVRPVALVRSVTPGYFAASGSTIRAGRSFTDSESQLVAIVSESLAARLWPAKPAGDIVGQKLRQGGNMSSPLIEVIGVVAEARPGGLDRDATAALYRPYSQWASGPMTLIVRTGQDPALLASSVTREIRRMDADLPVNSMRTMREVVSSTVAQRRFQMLLVSLFAIVALLLSVVGVYGVTNYAVACRTRDIGVRLALGATRGDVMRWTFAIGMWPVIVGLAMGCAAAGGSAIAFRAMLFGISPLDPIAFAAVSAVLIATAGVACYLPARRAGALDPILTLRHE